MPHKNSTLARIALFTYNRPVHTQKVLEALCDNKLASQSELIIFSDGAKREADIDRVLKTREVIKKVIGFKNIELVFRENNFGLAKSIISGVTELIDTYQKLIILEDDLVTSPYFLKFMNDALDYYENDDRVISVNGYRYPFKKETENNYFLKGADCWGWATWKRGWNLFKPDGQKLLAQIREQKAEYEFDVLGSYPYCKMLQDQVEGRNDSWAIRWQASAFLQKKMTLYPKTSLVQNIGIDGSGTHSNTSSVFDTFLSPEAVPLTDIPVVESEEIRAALRKYFLSLREPIWRRAQNRIRRMLRKRAESIFSL